MNTLRMTPEQAAAHQERAQGWRKPKPPSLAEINAEVARLEFNQAKPSKYRAQPTECAGIRFASKGEAALYERLLLLQQAGEVAYFLRQVPLHLPGGVKYVVDFLVVDLSGGLRFLDFKGKETPLFIAKKKIAEATYPVRIECITRKRGEFIGL